MQVKHFGLPLVTHIASDGGRASGETVVLKVSEHQSSIRRAHLTVALVASVLLTACTTPTGTRISPTQGDLANIARLGTLVSVTQPFSVSLSLEQKRAGAFGTTTSLGQALTLLDVLESVARGAEDHAYARDLMPLIGDYDPMRVVSDQLNTQLRAQPKFRSATTAPSADHSVLGQAGFDALLEVMLKKWGLSACHSPEAPRDVQVSFDMEGRLSIVNTGTVIWERVDLYLDGECHSVDILRADHGLLRSALARASERLARRIVNEILFP